MSLPPPPPEDSSPYPSGQVPPPPPGYGPPHQSSQFQAGPAAPGPTPYQQPTPPRKGGSGLAIAALIVAILALLLSWVPIINNFAFVLGLFALVLGAIAWFRTRKGRRTGKGLSVAAVVVSLVAIAAVIATQSFYSDVLDEVERSVSDDTADEADDADAANVAAPAGEDAPEDTPVDAVATEDEPVEDEPAEDEPAEDAQQGETGVLGLGASADVGDYSVTIRDVQLDATDAVKQANQFNDAPDGQYVLVGVDVTYNGDEDGDPWLDLAVELAGSDARVYDSSSCMAVTPNSAMDLPTLTRGGSGSFDICFDVPAEAVDNPQIHVEESFSFGDTRVTWGMDKADPADIAAPAATEDEEVAAAEPPADALAVGDTAEIGEYAVTVTDVHLNATDAIMQANQFNEAPTGQYVLVSLDVTYSGDEEGDPWLDLMVELAGSDARVYDTSSCMAVTPNSAMDVPTLTAGGQGAYDVCFDLPTEALDGALVYVEESLSFEETRAVWLTSK